MISSGLRLAFSLSVSFDDRFDTVQFIVVVVMVMVSAFCVCLKNICLLQGHKDVLLWFFVCLLSHLDLHSIWNLLLLSCVKLEIVIHSLFSIGISS